MPKISFDFETFSACDLKKCGVSKYARDPSTEILMVAWRKSGDSEVSQWDRTQSFRELDRFYDLIEDDRNTLQAWNSAFEWNILKHVAGIHTEFDRYIDPMIMARHMALPGKLSEIGKVIGLDEELWKHANGTALINFFCKPRKPTKRDLRTRNMPSDNEEKWSQLLHYNRQDVVAESEAFNWLKRWDMPDEEWDMWFEDRAINERGVPASLEAIRNAVQLVDDVTEDRIDRMAEATGLKNPNSPVQLLGWLKDRDYPFNDLKAGHVRRAIEMAKEDGDENTAYYETLVHRTEISKASVKKYVAYENATNDDGLLRNMMVFAGAGRTSRWAGELVQLHNLARPTKDFEKADAQIALARAIRRMKKERFEFFYPAAMDALSSGVRGVICAPDGKLLYDADLNAIENRVLGYMAEEERILNVFKHGRDPYVDFATYMFDAPYEQLWAEYKAGDKTKRTTAKPGVLGCGYMLGEGKEYEDEDTGEIVATGLLGYAWGMGVKLTPQQSKDSVRVWRETYSKCVDFWYEVSDAVFKCIRNKKRTYLGPFEFDIDGPWLKARLPSGRYLYYFRPRIMDWMKPWGEKGPSITYEGVDSKSSRKAWGRISTHPGKITENLDQAIARDVLRDKIMMARKEGLDIRLHTHDQITGLADERDAEEHARILAEIMSIPCKWAPDLPLKAEAEVSKYYLKT